MKVHLSNSILALILALALCTGLRAQDGQAPPSGDPSGAQPQSEPAQPDQTAPDQQPPKEPAQPPAQSPDAAQPKPEQAPPEQGQPKEMPQSVAPAQSPSTPPKAKTGSVARSKSSRKKRTSATKTHPTAQSGKVVVRNGGVRESTTQISPGVNDQQAKQQRDVTNQLLVTTDANLKKMSGKQLTSAQQGMLDQVNSYVRQSKAASDAGDISRAHTLAVKAQLLSNELAR